MRFPRVAVRVFPSLVCASLLALTTPVRADWIQISVGPPRNPYVTDPGNAYYPGGNGAIVPGYGYYPEYSDHWPTLREALEAKRHGYVPGTRPPAPVIPIAPVEPVILAPVAPAPSSAASLRVRVPADAELWFDNTHTSQQGVWRHFVTPPISAEGELSYQIRARWTVDGQAVERTQTVPIRPGDSLTVDFLAPPGPEKIPAPRRTSDK